MLRISLCQKVLGSSAVCLVSYSVPTMHSNNSISTPSGLEDLKGKETLKYAKPEEAEKVSQSEPHQNQAERRWKRDAKIWKVDRWEWKTYQTKSKETCLQSNRAIGTSQRLSISDFCEFLQKSEIESLFSCSYRQFIVLLQKDFWNNKCKVDNLTITIWFIQARKSSYFCSLSCS